MLFNYDSWNRMQTITYPDGEVASYSYDCGGNLAHVAGNKNGEPFPYVDVQQYNKYGQRSWVSYGNGTHTEYTYDNLQRLSHLTSYDGQGNAMQDIVYTFDAVSNISQVSNFAPAIGTLGGQYTNEYVYDNLYRLTNATQSYGTGNQLDVSYSPNGRVLIKDQTHLGQNLTYAYCPDYQPHAIRRILNHKDNTMLDLQWDANGNLAQVNHYNEGGADYDHSRFLYWTEDNRLSAVVDPIHFSYYGYDYAGERTLKLTGTPTLLDVNADAMSFSGVLDRATLYTSPYMVCTEKGYTKHVYAGTERLCAKRGGGGFGTMAQLLGTDAALQGNAKDLFIQVIDDMRDRHLPSTGCAEPLPMYGEAVPSFVKASVTAETGMLTNAITDYNAIMHLESDRYFYHSDHLGSASWITDTTGAPIQHMQYCPYGEPFVDQHPANIYQERFTFTGKERDEETGYHYFGARYLDADLMTGWLSVDPLSDSMPSTSPYIYCHNNPVRLVDSDGNIPIETIWDIGNLAYDVGTALVYHAKGDHARARSHWGDAALDAVAVAVPYVPAGTTKALKATNAVAKGASTSTKTIPYRKILQQATGKEAKGYDAHHTLPQVFREKFEKAGLNIDDPANMVWRKSSEHRGKSQQQIAEWRKFFNNNPNPTKNKYLSKEIT